MTVTDYDSIDMIARDESAKTIILGIVDHLDWLILVNILTNYQRKLTCTFNTSQMEKLKNHFRIIYMVIRLKSGLRFNRHYLMKVNLY